MKTDKLGFFYLLNTVVLFSTFEVVSKTLVGKIDPFQLNFLRFLLGGIILFLIILLKADVKLTFSELIQVSIIGVINVAISMSLLQLSLFENNAKASVVAVIFSSNPIFVTVFSALINKEKIRLNKISGLLIGIIGITFIFLEKLQFSLTDFRSPLMALLAAISYGLYTVIGGRVSSKIGSLKMNAYSFILGSLVLLPGLLYFKIPVIRFDYSGIYQVLYIAVFVTGLAYFTYFKGLSITGTSKGSLVFFIKPVLASLIAIIFLKENATLNLFIGTFMILIGITIAIHWDKIKAKGYQLLPLVKK